MSSGAARQAVCDARAVLEADACARESDCADIRSILTGSDRRRHRSRRVRGHLRACVACRAWRPERRPLLLLPGGGLLWNVASWFNTRFTAGSGSVAGAARSTALVVAVSAGSFTLATDRPPRERPRVAATLREAAAPRPVLVATATPDTLTFRAAGAPTTAAGEPHGTSTPSPSANPRDETPSFDRSGETWPRNETDGGASHLRGDVRAAGENRGHGGAADRQASAGGDTRPSGQTGAGGDTRASGQSGAGGGARSSSQTGAGGGTQAGGGSWVAGAMSATGDTRAERDTRTSSAATPTAMAVPTQIPTAAATTTATEPAATPTATAAAEPTPPPA